MKPYFTFFRMRLINGMQYRAAAYAGMVTQFFWGLMEIQLYKAFYAANPDRFPMEFAHLTSYIWLRQAFLALLNAWRAENTLFESVLTGNVAYELCRPTSLYGMWFARTVANRVSDAALRCGPILIFAAFLPTPYGLRFAASPGAFAAFLFSLALGTCVCSAMILLLYFSCFFLVSSEGIRMIFIPVVELLSGSLIPLPFMPDAMAKIVNLSPFGAMANAPLRIYSGDIAGADAAMMIGLQLFWLAVMIAIGRLLQRRGLRKLSVQGG